MKKFILFISLIFCLLNVSDVLAQFNYIWAGQFGSTLNDKGTAVITDATGNVYSVGTFSGTCDFDPSAASYPLVSSGSSDVYISKLTSAGAFVWAKKIGGTVADNVGDLAKDAAGNIYLVGDFSGTCDFDPSAATFNLVSPGTTSDIYVCKLDMNGNFIWARQMGGNWWDRAVSVCIDSNGDVITTGDFATASTGLTSDFDPGPGTYTFTTGSGGGNTDMFISKLSSSGNFIWAKQIGGVSGDFGNAIEVDNANNIHICGYFTGSTDFDPNATTYSLSSNGFEDIFVLKLNSTGNFIWAKNMGGNTVDYGKGLALDASGNVYTTGSFRSIADMDPGAPTYTLGAVGDDIFVSKLDAAGNFVWAKGMGSSSADQGNGIATDALGNVYTTGVFRLSVDFDPSASSYSLNTLGMADVFLHKLSSAGNFLWAAQLGSATDDFGFGISVDVSGNVHSTGYFTATCDFDPAAPFQNLTSVGQNDAFVYKMCQTTLQPGNISGLAAICGSATTIYSLALIAGATSYNWSLPSGWSGTSTTNSISATSGSSGLFTVTATNACGVSPIQTLSVTINVLPIVSATSNTTSICIGQSATLTANGANSYTWLPVGSGSNIVVSPTITSTYTVSGTDGNGCSNTNTITQTVITCPTGLVESNSNSNFNIYPNPANNEIHIRFTSIKSDRSLRIYNSIGQLVHNSIISEQNSIVDIKGLNTGIYFVEIKTATQTFIQKLIKN